MGTPAKNPAPRDKMNVVTRRIALWTTGRFFLAASCFAAAATPSVRGKLTRSRDNKVALETADHKLIALDGDGPTVGVLDDQRLWGSDFEALGHFNTPDHFEIDGIHNRAMFVHRDGQRLMITYWCDVCYIRTYTPGICVCCQKYTDLDLREPDHP
jgi:hypothetical protein